MIFQLGVKKNTGCSDALFSRSQTL